MAIPFLKSKARAVARPDDPLAQFEAESESTAAAAPAPGTPADSLPQTETDSSVGAFDSSEAITLEMVLAQRTFVSWSEAVAIVEGTCGALVAADGTELPAPDPAYIALAADGRIEVQTGGFGFGRGDSVQRLARALHVLTSGQAVPAPLRLFISKWIAADGKHSIAEFARELAYFARPDGAELIRQVYQRYLSAPAVKAPAAPQKKTDAESRNAQKQQPPPAKRRQSALVAAGIAFLLAAAVSIAFYRPAQVGEAGSSDLLATLMARASEFARSLGDVRTQIGDLSTQLSAHLAGGDAPAGAAPTAPASAPTASNRPRPTGRSSGGAVAPRVAAISVLPTISDAPVGVVVETPTPADPLSLELAGATTGPPEAPAPVVAVARDPNAVYSNEDPNVNPPKMVYPQLPPPALVLGSSSVNVMEIIIGDDGRVEKVKLTSIPRRMTDMMLLSGAKLWRFDPASLDGLPVKYRMAVSWSASVP